MSVNVTVVPSYENYGKCLKLENDVAELYVTIDVGPRIIKYNLKGCENMMFNDLERNHTEKGEDFDRCFYPGAAWYIYGGHRLWASPELYPSSYYPENDPVEYEIDGNTVRLTPPPQKYTNLQFRTEITMDCCSSKVTVHHSIENLFCKPVTVAPWALSVMAPGGVETIPMPKRSTGYLANRVLSLWDYTDMADPRVTWGKDFITLRQDSAMEQPFKIGLNVEHGWAKYENRGQVFTKHFSYDPELTYPDYGVCFETYTCARFTEIETVGELKELKPGERVEHEEQWELERAQH